MSQQRAPRIAHRNDALIRRVQALKAEHPFCGATAGFGRICAGAQKPPRRVLEERDRTRRLPTCP